MRASLRALLGGVIDYAGLFPPAKLSLENAFRNFVRYLESADRWLLGRFICPAGQLPHLAMLLRHGEAATHAVPLSILGRGDDEGAAFFANLTEDLAYIADFQAGNNHAQVDSFEVRLPAPMLRSGAAEQREFVQQLSAALAAVQSPLAVALEVGFAGDWRQSLPTFLDNLHQHASHWGLKLRCGGLVPDAFPTVEQVAFVLHACRSRKTPVKFTAGLHHPFRHAATLGAETIRMHGFINIFTAGVLMYARNIGEEELRQIVADEEANHFRFDDGALQWQGFSASLEEIAAARRLVTSFGSCSFEEPLDDLRTIS